MYKHLVPSSLFLGDIEFVGEGKRMWAGWRAFVEEQVRKKGKEIELTGDYENPSLSLRPDGSLILSVPYVNRESHGCGTIDLAFWADRWKYRRK